MNRYQRPASPAMSMSNPRIAHQILLLTLRRGGVAGVALGVAGVVPAVFTIGGTGGVGVEGLRVLVVADGLREVTLVVLVRVTVVDAGGVGGVVPPVVADDLRVGVVGGATGWVVAGATVGGRGIGACPPAFGGGSVATDGAFFLAISLIFLYLVVWIIQASCLCDCQNPIFSSL